MEIHILSKKIFFQNYQFTNLNDNVIIPVYSYEMKFF